MGAPIPDAVKVFPLDRELVDAGLTFTHQGKVRHTYELPSEPNQLLLFATPRVSVFDFPLNAVVEKKNEVLVAMTVFWLSRLFSGTAHHLLAWGQGLDKHLPSSLRGKPELQKSTVLVKKLRMAEMDLPKTEGEPQHRSGLEAVVRGFLTGSGWKTYREQTARAREAGIPAQPAVCGHALPPGLHDGSELIPPIFTPTSKEETGHDEHVGYEWVRNQLGPGPENLALALYKKASDYARERGIIIADTKFEFGFHSRASFERLTVADEVLTPDSSRFWKVSDWQTEQTKPNPKSPPAFDKQYVRDYCNSVETPFFDAAGQPIIGIGHKDFKTDNEAHWRFVHGLVIPPEVLQRTTEIYLEIFRLLTGAALKEFQRDAMGIKV